MQTITLKVSCEGRYIRCQLDEKTILAVNHPYDNQFSIQVPSKGRYLLSFFIKGDEGDQYSIRLLSPVTDELKDTLGSDGKAFGYMEIDLT